MSDTYKKLPVTGLTDELIEETTGGDKAVRVTGEISVTEGAIARTPTVVNINIPSANTEVSFAIPDGTAKYFLKLQQNDAVLKVAYTSGGDQITLKRGTTYTEERLDTVSVTLYLESNKANKTVELVYWQ